MIAFKNRFTMSLLLLSFFGCGNHPAARSSSTIASADTISIKNTESGFDSISISQISRVWIVQYAVEGPNAHEEIMREFANEDAQRVVRLLPLESPVREDAPSSATETGMIAVYEQTPTGEKPHFFSIQNESALQDRAFPEIYYNADQFLDANWLKSL